MHILLAESDKLTASVAAKVLRAEGFRVQVSRTGAAALAATAGTHFATVVLATGLPGNEGLAVLRKLRARGVATPVLLLAARGSVAECVEGLGAGADDYLRGPFAIEEFTARVLALVRRGRAMPPVVLRVGDLSLNLVTHRAERAGREIVLSGREFQMLKLLIRAAGQLCPYTQINDAVWGDKPSKQSNRVHVYAAKLRKKIDAGQPRKLVHTVMNRGYLLGDAMANDATRRFSPRSQS